MSWQGSRGGKRTFWIFVLKCILDGRKCIDARKDDRKYIKTEMRLEKIIMCENEKNMSKIVFFEEKIIGDLFRQIGNLYVHKN